MVMLLLALILATLWFGSQTMRLLFAWVAVGSILGLTAYLVLWMGLGFFATSPNAAPACLLTGGVIYLIYQAKQNKRTLGRYTRAAAKVRKNTSNTSHKWLKP